MGTPKYRGRRDRTMDDKLMYPQNLYPNSGLNKQEGYFRLFITLVPFYNNVILIIGSSTLETFIEFDWLVH